MIKISYISGLILRIPIFDEPKEMALYDDESTWETPEDFKEVQPLGGNLIQKPTTKDEQVWHMFTKLGVPKVQCMISDR